MSLPRIPVGGWVEALEDWLEDNFEAVFDAFDVITVVHEGLYALLLQPPVLVFAGLAGLLGWFVRGWRFGVYGVVAFAFIDSLRLWSPAMSTLALVLVSSGIAIAFAVPVGIAAARNRHVSNLVRPVLDFMQTMPAFVYLIPAITFFGIGEVPGVVATVIFSMPPGVRLTELGIRQVDPEMVEAGEAFGTPPRRILTRIQIPLALPTIRAGVNQVIMLALSMVVISGMVGAGGLGSLVFEAIGRIEVGAGFEAGLAVVLLAVFLDRLTAGTRRSTVRELVKSARARRAPATEPVG